MPEVDLRRIGDTLFALVPGGEVNVGFDPNHFTPTEAQTASYKESVAAHGLPSLHDYLEQHLTPRRTVQIPTLLVAVHAVEYNVHPIPPNSPLVTDYLADLPQAARIALRGRTMDGGLLRINFDAHGTPNHAWKVSPETHKDAVEHLAQQGMRLPSPEEWDHACGAEAPTLFWWGNECPMDNHPLGSTEHRRPNPFGLEIAQDPHHCEYTADPKVVCGGDGGVTLHHSVGLFIGWLTLATSYQAKNWPADPRRPSGRWVRPVIELTE